MSDFKKALGILSKAKQGGLFDKLEARSFLLPAGRYHSAVLGKTRSGKQVSGKQFGSGKEFFEHHAGWTSQDHSDAIGVHDAHMARIKQTQPDDEYFTAQHAMTHHDQMGYAHSFLSMHKNPEWKEHSDEGVISNIHHHVREAKYQRDSE